MSILALFCKTDDFFYLTKQGQLVLKIYFAYMNIIPL